MNVTKAKAVAQEVLAPFHFSSLEDAGMTFLYLSCLAKIAEYKSDEEKFENKYGTCFDVFQKRLDEKVNEESFEEEDDRMAWQYARDARQYWENKVRDMEQCF